VNDYSTDREDKFVCAKGENELLTRTFTINLLLNFHLNGTESFCNV
jgi:hypothetical protein